MEVRSNMSMIPHVLRTAEDLSEEYGMTEDNMLRMRLNLEEILLGIVEYGYSDIPDATIDIRFSLIDGEMEISVTDHGRPYDYNTLEGDGYSDIARILTGTGFGPDLVNHGREGREQTFRFPVQNILDDTPAAPADVVIDGSEFDFHIMRPEEGMQVSQCLYDEFGYTYVYDIVYYPEKLSEAMKLGALTPFTAVSPKGEVAAHVALMSNPHLPGTMELAMGVVKKKFRKASLMSRLTDLALQYGDETGLTSINAQPVGYHPYTQKICEATSMGACAVCFNYSCSDMATSHGSGSRMTLFWAVRMMRDEHRTMYVPQEVTHIAEMVVRNCSLDRVFSNGSEPAADNGSVSGDMNHILGLCKIYVDSIGRDSFESVRVEHHRAKSEHMEVSDILINLQDPAAPWLYEKVKGLGYFCTGILPASSKCDYLIMQTMLYGTIDYNIFQTTPQFRELLEAVRLLDPEGDL